MILADRRSVALTEHGIPEAVNQEFFSPNAFEFFGVAPLFGRTFHPNDAGDESKVEDVAVLSYLFWQRHFFGRRDVIGQSVRLNDKFYTVIGVLPIRFTWQDADIYTPVAIRPDNEYRYGMVMRVRQGIPRQQIDSEFQAFNTKFAKTAPSFMYPDPPFRTQFSLSTKASSENSPTRCWRSWPLSASFSSSPARTSPIYFSHAPALAVAKSQFAPPWARAPNASCSNFSPRASF